MNHITPCEDPANDPEDWFIERDGKQYPDDELLADEDIARIASGVESNTAVEYADPASLAQAVDEAIDKADAEAIKAALVRRRHAKDKCYTECGLRTQCLEIALSEPTPATHGTWGGYHQEELKQIRSERDARRARRQAMMAPSHDADVRSEE